MGVSEDKLVEFFHNVRGSSVNSCDTPTCKRVCERGEFTVCFLPTTTTLMVGAVPQSDADKLASCMYKSTAGEIKQDVKLTHTVSKGNGDGACQRSIELYAPLKIPTSKKPNPC